MNPKVIVAMKITKEEFTTLFGEEKTTAAYPRYEKFWKDLEQEGPADMVKRIKENKYDNVQVWRIDAADPKSVSGNEKNVMDSLANKETKVYSVRLVTGTESKGFMLVCFFKIGDNWRAGFKVGRMLVGGN